MICTTAVEIIIPAILSSILLCFPALVECLVLFNLLWPLCDREVLLSPLRWEVKWFAQSQRQDCGRAEIKSHLSWTSCCHCNQWTIFTPASTKARAWSLIQSPWKSRERLSINVMSSVLGLWWGSLFSHQCLKGSLHFPLLAFLLEQTYQGHAQESGCYCSMNTE